MQTKMSDEFSTKDGSVYFADPEKLNKAVKNAHRLHIFPTISKNNDTISIYIDGEILEKLNGKCSTSEMEMFKLLIAGYNQTEVSEQLNVSQSNVSRKIAKLRRILSSGE